MMAGGNPMQGSYEAHIEIYSPAYLFNADGNAAARPTISGLRDPTARASMFNSSTCPGV